MGSFVSRRQTQFLLVNHISYSQNHCIVSLLHYLVKYLPTCSLLHVLHHRSCTQGNDSQGENRTSTALSKVGVSIGKIQANLFQSLQFRSSEQRPFLSSSLGRQHPPSQPTRLGAFLLHITPNLLFLCTGDRTGCAPSCSRRSSLPLSVLLSSSVCTAQLPPHPACKHKYAVRAPQHFSPTLLPTTTYPAIVCIQHFVSFLVDE